MLGPGAGIYSRNSVQKIAVDTDRYIPTAREMTAASHVIRRAAITKTFRVPEGIVNTEEVA